MNPPVSNPSSPAGPAAPPLRLVFWETTVGCNLECKHCRRLEVSHELMKTDLSTAEGRTLIDQIAAVGRPVLVFSGGEPLMRPDIFELAGYAKQRGLLVALATNGTLLDESTADRIAAAGFDRVSASLDGADAATHDGFRGLAGAFDQTMEGLARLRARGVPFQVNCTIARHDKDQIQQVLELAEQIGAVAVHYFLLVPVGCGEQIAEDQMLSTEEVEDRLRLIARLQRQTNLQIKPTCAPHYYRIIRQEARELGLAMPKAPGHPSAAAHGHPSGGQPGGGHPGGGHPGGHPGGGQPAPQPDADPDKAALHSITKGCLAGTAVCFVSHEGDVFPCGYLPVAAGNVRRQNFGDIWRDSLIFNQFRDVDQLTGKCGACEYRNVCSGCRARAFYQHGDYLAEEPYCAHEPATPRR